VLCLLDFATHDIVNLKDLPMSGLGLEGSRPFSEREKRWRSYVAGISQGKAESLTLLYDESAASLLGLALRIVKNAADAEEIVLEVYEQVWRTAHSFDPLRASVWRWLSILIKSRAIDRLRTAASRRNQERLQLTDLLDVASNEPLPESATILNQERIFVRSALNTLPKEQRQAVELAYFSELTHVEIAAELGVPLGTIKTRIRSGMEKLRLVFSQGQSAVVGVME
jgi:RNA polymerase sigma-70 factor, ECF subfamily